jgi:hypothetical protein
MRPASQPFSTGSNTIVGGIVNTLIPLALASSFAVACACASAAELTNEDRAELRQRADELQAQRARNPDYQPGEGRLNPQPTQAPRAHARHTSKKTVAKSAPPETRRAKVARKARSLKKIPGAFVRK